jgi:hypothetical protein
MFNEAMFDEIFNAIDELNCDEIDETNRTNRDEIKRPPDSVIAAHAAGRFTPERPARSSRGKKRRRRQNARAPPSDDDDDAADAYSIAAFCRRHNISESFYHKLRNQGLGPRTMRVGSRVLITRQAAREWRRARERAEASSAAT